MAENQNQPTAEKFLATEDGQALIANALLEQNKNLKTLAEQKQGAYESALAAAAAAEEAKKQATASQTAASKSADEASKAAANAAEGIAAITGDKTKLATSDKSNLVNAINELKKNTENNAKAITNISQSTGALPVTFTLEGSTSPAFERNDDSAVKEYIAAMGGYLLLNKDGKVYAAKLGADWSTLSDGTPVTAALEAATETMIHVPVGYYEGNDKTCKFYGLQGPSTAKKYTGPNWVGAYIASGSSAGLHSRPNTTPAHSQTMSTFQSWAQKLGSDWGQWKYQTWSWINLLYQARYGNLNSQATIGAGFQHSNWEAARNVPMGKCKSLGDGSGSVLYSDATLGNQYPVKLFGFEDLWGKLWQFTPGIRFYMDGSTRHAVIYDGNVVSNSAAGRDVSPVLSSASGTYANRMQLGEYWDMICQQATGSDTTNYCDGYWASTGGELLVVGAASSHESRCGLASSYSNLGFSYSYSNLGARLAFFGEPTIVSGATLVTLAGV